MSDIDVLNIPRWGLGSMINVKNENEARKQAFGVMEGGWAADDTERSACEDCYEP